MKGFWARAAWVYLALLLAFLLAAPYFAPGGGYSRVTAFKAVGYGLLTALFLLLSLPGLFSGRLRASPWRWLAVGYLAFSLLSALCSPWRRVSLLGGSRQEGFLILALYALSFLALSRRSLHTKGLLPLLAIVITLLNLLCLLQLRGANPLRLYPDGMAWQDANLRYPGAYLGTVGNAGLTCAVIAVAASLFFCTILQRGGRSWLLLPVLLLCIRVLALADVSAPQLAFWVVVWLSLCRCEPRLRALWRWLSLLFFVLPLWLTVQIRPFLFPLLLLAWVCYLLGRFGPDLPLRRVTLPLLAAALLLAVLAALLRYDGWSLPLREAAALLQGRCWAEMGSGRVYIWQQVLNAVPAHLWLGTGPDTLLLQALEPYVWVNDAGRVVRSSIDAAHNELLQTLSCQGLPAALCHLGLMVCALVQFFRHRGSAAGLCAAGALCYAVQAQFGISACASAPLFWVLLALSLNPSLQGGHTLAFQRSE